MKKQAEQLIKDFVTGFLAGDWGQFRKIWLPRQKI